MLRYRELVSLLGEPLEAVLKRKPIKQLGSWSHRPPRVGSMYSYANAPTTGMALRANEDGVIDSIFLYSEGFEGFSAYRGELIKKLAFGDTREQVEAKLGTPARFQEQITDRIMGVRGAFVLYFIDSAAMQVRFSPSSGTVELITVMIPEIAPRG